ncbi:hypothetical protein HMSP1_21 [Sinorhizobium phage HMSP1-Susan]|nr:hypothetical protein HMSP1_21 [Sinorhizobium phage HMSP1-Susan]
MVMCECGADEYTGHSMSCVWSKTYEMSTSDGWGKIPDMSKADIKGLTATPVFLGAPVTILFPDGEREIPIAADGKPRKTPGYVYEQTITGEWFAVRT